MHKEIFRPTRRLGGNSRDGSSKRDWLPDELGETWIALQNATSVFDSAGIQGRQSNLGLMRLFDQT